MWKAHLQADDDHYGGTPGLHLPLGDNSLRLATSVQQKGRHTVITTNGSAIFSFTRCSDKVNLFLPSLGFESSQSKMLLNNDK